MKKNLLTFALMFAFIGAYSQKIEIQNASNYSRNKEITKAVDCIERAVGNEDTKNDCKAWYLRGTILLQLDDMYSMIRLGTPGMTVKEYNKALAPFNPVSPNSSLSPEATKTTKNDDGSKTTKAIYIYDVTAYFKDGKLETVTDPTDGKYKEMYQPSILDVAVESFDKAIKIGNEEEYVDKSKTNLQLLVDRFYNLAVVHYNAKQYLDAARYFEKSSNISSKYLNKPNDENMAYAKECYRYQINEDLNKKDTANALAICQEGLQKFPDNTDIMLSEANIWLAKGENQKVIDRLENVVKYVKDNPSIYFIIGQSYANLHNEEKAIDAYSKVLAINPNHFETNYNIASIYFNDGTDLAEQANQLPVDKENEAKYNELMAKSSALYEKAIPYLEKANAATPEDLVILQALKNVYSRLNRAEDALKVNNKIKEIQAKQSAAPATVPTGK